MDRDEFNRLKEAEKAHLRKVRALKQQLREANRKKGLLGALKALDTSALDATHEEALRKVTEQNITSEARFEIAMEALDAAEKQEADRAEMMRLEAERQKTAASDLVRQMKTQMLGDAADHIEARQRPPQPEADPTAEPDKTIGPSGSRDDMDGEGAERDSDEDTASGSEAPPPSSAKTIGRFRPDAGGT